uniref:EF-hand domain-containing protein n=1 Tax=Guillardia theta TaxID=55529 RepID=A0A6U5YY65_GUITH|mmetsp:Transcript_23487/g.76489  ORF Transcript_23487/g.76489 Transcript_23487/m.76489 type:complete len:833 (+) Transcript_23487:184-2682(+)
MRGVNGRTFLSLAILVELTDLTHVDGFLSSIHVREPRTRLQGSPPPCWKVNLRPRSRVCMTAVSDVDATPAASQSAGGDEREPVGDLEQICSPMHVQIKTKIEAADMSKDIGSIGLLRLPLQTKSQLDFHVFLNDTIKKPSHAGWVSLDSGDADRASQFSVLGNMRYEKPGFLQILPPVADETMQRLWMTGFGLARPGSVVGVDVRGRDATRKCSTEFLWPNAVEHVAADEFKGLDEACILVADGFLVPGKNDGSVTIVKDPGGPNEVAYRLTESKKSWFYHRAVPLHFGSARGVLTARARKPILPFQEAEGELVWLEQPDTVNPFAEWNLPWREVILAEGPDVMFEVVDLDPEDDTVEVVAAEFFRQRLSFFSLRWDETCKSPKVVQTELIDDKLGQAYSVVAADLEGPNSHLLVTTHEDLTAEVSEGSSLLPWRSSKWSYRVNIPPPRDLEVDDEQEVKGGSLFAYRIPVNWKRSRERSSSFNTNDLVAMFQRLDVDNSGSIDIQDLTSALKTMQLEVRDYDIQAMLKEVDWDGSGQIEFSEFQRLCQELDEQRRSNPLQIIGNALKNFENAVSRMQGEEEKVLDDEDLKKLIPEIFRSIDIDRSGGVDMISIRNAFDTFNIECSDVELANLFIEADTDGNGLLDVDEFQRLMRRFYREVQVHRKDLWLNVLQILESAFAKGVGSGGSEKLVWRRTTISSGFMVKRVGINPGAPGFVYPFHPHESLRQQGLPPHLFVAGDCADAAYIFRPVKKRGGGTSSGRELAFQYQLLATFGFEGTVGSLAVARVDTLQSVDDGWVKFFIPVYESDRVFMFKYGEPPSLGYTPDDEW